MIDRASTTITYIPGLKLRWPIVAVLTYYPEEVIASYPELDSWASGGTDVEAIEGLKESIFSLASDIKSFKESELSHGPRRLRDILRNMTAQEKYLPTPNPVRVLARVIGAIVRLTR